jgi:hypothetical protein
MNRGAEFSSCGKFRYLLIREWDEILPWVVFVMLNPSTADARKDDATIRKCIAFAKYWGFGGIKVVNLFAFRATKPADLKRAGYPVGGDNVPTLVKVFEEHANIICAWGAQARNHPQAATVLGIIRGLGRQPEAIRTLSDGVPEHPLYIPISTPRVRL